MTNTTRSLLTLNNATDIHTPIGRSDLIAFSMTDDDVLQLMSDAVALDVPLHFTRSDNGSYAIAA
jgi:hypothetical protein